MFKLRQLINTNRSRCSHRRGAVAVEFAVISPLVFLLIFGSIEFGRGMMVVHTMEEAVRTGCRMAIVDGATTSEVETAVQTLLHSNGVTAYTLTISPALASVCQWDPVTVSVTVNYGNVSWLPSLMYLGGKTFTAACTLPMEGDPCNET
ncbi:MAG: TadE/TadG family type IV pilus assembly protein [Pirellulales bacterium]